MRSRLLPLLLPLLALLLTLPSFAQQPPATPAPLFQIVCPFGSACVQVITQTPAAAPSATLRPATATNTLPATLTARPPTAAPSPTNTPTPSATAVPTSIPTATRLPLQPSPTSEVIGGQSATFQVGTGDNHPVDPSLQPLMPFICTQVYFVEDAIKTLFQALKLACVRIDLTTGAFDTQIVSSLTPGMFALMSVDACCGGGDGYAQHFLDEVVFWNVTNGKNFKYWEVMNEPDYHGESPTVYADIFKRTVAKIRAYPDPRVNSILIGGPTLGSGDPIDGTYPTGYANQTSNRNGWRDYMPLMRDQADYLTWHDYGETGAWGNGIMLLENLYSVANRVNAFAGNKRVFISETNADAGSVTTDTAAKLWNFYAALWFTSELNQYASTGKVIGVVHFDFGNVKTPSRKGFVDFSGQALPVYYSTQAYLETAQTHLLTAQNGLINRWADVTVSVSEDGKTIGVIAVNKATTPTTIDLPFDVPLAFNGDVTIQRQQLTAGGAGDYGAISTPPVTVTSIEALSLPPGSPLHYQETLPARSIVYAILTAP